MIKTTAKYVLLLILVAGTALYLYFTLIPESVNHIMTLPGDYDPYAYYPGYAGPHPSDLKRPTETFPFPIHPGESGPVEPLFAGPLHYPFLCRSEESGLGQPQVDNREGAGIRVYAEDEQGHPGEEVIGYSKDCSLKTRVHYIYRDRSSGDFHPLEGDDPDIDTIRVNGRKTPYILRVETGTINRHPYVLLALRGDNETPAQPDPGNWNRKLIYQFRGGVGIGKRQGRLNIDTLVDRREAQLSQGYAVIHSTANQTSNHYNIWLAEDTALRVKRQFTALYGEADYTVGIGGSGGGLQQYLLGQNNPGIIDAAIAQYAYPDMITQTTYVLDCELLEYYFDVTARDNSRWLDWSSRRYIEGLNAKDLGFNKYTWLKLAADLVSLKVPRINSGSSECASAWRGLTPLILNPRFPQLPERLNPHVQSQIQLTYWDDLKYFYGTDDSGHARISWGNAGVQYGLVALKQGHITVEEFLHLNHNIGSWKRPRHMQKERFWFLDGNSDTVADNFSPWSQHNMRLSPDGGLTPAPRRHPDPRAIAAAFHSGQVFIGKIDIPVIDMRHYLDDELDMHHSLASFQARARILEYRGHADNHIIWVTRKPHIPTQKAFQVIDRWLGNIRTQGDKSMAEIRPESAVDTCFNQNGKVIASGQHVWDGDWNGRPPGECMKHYPVYSTSRLQAGEPITGDRFSCAFQSVQQAIDRGIYEPIDMRPYVQQLTTVFPQGVCNYSQPDPARPKNMTGY